MKKVITGTIIAFIATAFVLASTFQCKTKKVIKKRIIIPLASGEFSNTINLKNISIFPFKSDLKTLSNPANQLVLHHDKRKNRECIRFKVKIENKILNIEKRRHERKLDRICKSVCGGLRKGICEGICKGRIGIPKFFIIDDKGKYLTDKTGHKMKFYQLVKKEAITKTITVERKKKTVVGDIFVDDTSTKENKPEETKDTVPTYEVKFFNIVYPQTYCFKSKPKNKSVIAIYVMFTYIHPFLSEICFKEKVECPKEDKKDAFCNKPFNDCNDYDRKNCYKKQPNCPKIMKSVMKDIAEDNQKQLMQLKDQFEKIEGKRFIHFKHNQLFDSYLRKMKIVVEDTNKKYSSTASGSQKKYKKVAKFGSKMHFRKWTIFSPSNIFRLVKKKPKED